MAYCVNCGSQIPDGQMTCSMCYGDVAHGEDGYYMEWLQDSGPWPEENDQEDDEDN